MLPTAMNVGSCNACMVHARGAAAVVELEALEREPVVVKVHLGRLSVCEEIDAASAYLKTSKRM